ncbi:hypothetical protein CVT26_004586 [Gymnopilus dilepis]|uniref:Uncharacterized protein n=1 Tax=Gymnopilus dilepis TaxID=231916 RepID=A0A409WC23_9AGAR|nr:hypothetical protein CVT26_004586 [Gymnopilus dilepis]
MADDLPELIMEELNVDVDVHPLLQDALGTSAHNFDIDAGDNEGHPITNQPTRSPAPPPPAPPRSSLRLTMSITKPGAIEKLRRKAKSRLRRDWRRQNTPLPALPLKYRPRSSAVKRHARLCFIKGVLDVSKLPAGIWVGKRRRTTEDGKPKRPWTLPDLKTEGFRTEKWNGQDPRVLLDSEGRLIAVLAGRPADLDWDNVVANVDAAMVHARLTGKRDEVFPKRPEDNEHRRGIFSAIPSGVSFGGGQTRPGNLSHPPKKQAIINELLSNEDVQRVAGFQSSCLGFYFPKVYEDYACNLYPLYEAHPHLQTNFPDISIYPACTFNLGPLTATLEHTDAANVPYGLCAITAFGDFDPEKGGHLILFDLKLVIEFPPGSTILIPSSILRHGNTPIVGEGAGSYRMSLTQYCAGGLFRWVSYGFKTAKTLLSEPGGEERKRAIDGNLSDRTAAALELFSTVETLADDREAVFGKSFRN